MSIEQWAQRWGVPVDAVNELRTIMGAGAWESLNLKPGMSEGAVQQRVRLAAAQQGLVLWRNNVGVLEDDRGVPVRFGLANETKEVNRNVKSSDLIGIRPIVIQQHMVGEILGQFCAIETKKSGWQYGKTNDQRQVDHEAAQLKYIEIVRAAGGYAKFLTEPENFYNDQ